MDYAFSVRINGEIDKEMRCAKNGASVFHAVYWQYFPTILQYKTWTLFARGPCETGRDVVFSEEY